jgi:hypothetical protein
MYFATNIEPIALALEAAERKPRTLAEINRAAYPDAVIDSRGMAHAPCDGYVCMGEVYRGGEYLPSTGEYVGMSNGQPVYPVSFYINGETVVLMGKKGQRKAAAEVAKEQAAEHDRTIAQHVGAVNKREVFELTLIAFFADPSGFYGPEFTFYFRDAQGNPVVYKGAGLVKKTEEAHGTRWTSQIMTGGTVKIRATVKSHWTARDGRKATYINRPQLVEE